MLNSWHIHVIYHYTVPPCVHTGLISVSDSYHFCRFNSVHVCVMVYDHVHVHCVWIVQNVTVCWVRVPECDQCLCPTFGNILLRYCLTVTGMCLICVSVVYDYSASHCHSNSVGSSSMVILVCLSEYSIHPQTSIFPLESYCKSCAKNRILVSLIILNVCFLP